MHSGASLGNIQRLSLFARNLFKMEFFYRMEQLRLFRATGHAVGDLTPKHGSVRDTKKGIQRIHTQKKSGRQTGTSWATPPPLPRTGRCPLRGMAHFLPFAPGQARDWVGSRWAHSKVRSPKTTLQGHSPGAEPQRLPEPNQPQGRCPLGHWGPAARQPQVWRDPCPAQGPPVQPWSL